MYSGRFPALSLLWIGMAMVAIHADETVNAQDPFAPYLNDQPPAIVREINDDPSTHRSDIIVRRVVFKSRTVETKNGPQDSLVYAVIARPEADGNYPGLLVLHGGKGGAEEAKAEAWAARGYIAVAPDLPGIADPQKIPNSTGPWKLPYGAGRWVANPDVTSSTIFDGVLAAVQSLYLLRSQPQVMTDRIGVVGISWGGYATAMVCGLTGSDVKAAFALYGCGYYDKGKGSQMTNGLDRMPDVERRNWLTYLDAGRRVGGIKAAYFIAAATDDIFFFPPSVSATLADIPSEKNQVFSPNSAHQILVPGGTRDVTDGGSFTKMEVDYFDWYLKGAGQPFPKVTLLPSLPPIGGNGPVKVRFSVQSPDALDSTQVFYSLANNDWTKRKWEAVPATDVGNRTYEVELPANLGDLDWFALVSDMRPVSFSSTMEHVSAR
jgi:dienelactone hydrolase